MNNSLNDLTGGTNELYYDQSGFEIQPLSPLFLREDLGEFFKIRESQKYFHLSIKRPGCPLHRSCLD